MIRLNPQFNIIFLTSHPRDRYTEKYQQWSLAEACWNILQSTTSWPLLKNGICFSADKKNKYLHNATNKKLMHFYVMCVQSA